MTMTQLGDLTPDRWMIRVLWGTARSRPAELRELVPVVNEAGDAVDARTALEAAEAEAAAHGTDPDRVAALTGWVDELFSTTGDRLDDLDHDAIDAAVNALDPLEAAMDPFSAAVPFIGPAMPVVDPDAFAELVTGLSDIEVASAYMEAQHRPPRAAVLRRALFVTAIAEVEPHMAHLMRYLLLDRHPDKYTSLGDPLLAKAVRKACYGGPADWKAELVDKLKLTALDRTVPWAALEAAWEDRNAIHHRRGYVDTLEAVAAGIPVDTAADITTDYLYDTIDRVQVTMLALVLATSNRLATGDLEQLVPITVHGFAAAFRARRWSLALGLAAIRSEYATDLEDTEGGRVEQWLARSGAEGAATMRDEVLAWDTAGLEPIYDVARDLLLGRNDHALAKLNPLRHSGEVDGEMIEASVIFDPIRHRL
jgi:hypothetical protein